MGAPISCLIAAYVSCVVLSYSNNNYGVCMVRYTIYKYAWYRIQVYRVIQRLDGGLCSYAICRHASWLLKGFYKPIF